MIYLCIVYSGQTNDKLINVELFAILTNLPTSPVMKWFYFTRPDRKEVSNLL